MTMKKPSGVALAFDLGGTQLKTGVVTGSGRILHQAVFPSYSKEGREAVLRGVLAAVSENEGWCRAKKLKIIGAGFGIPGIIGQPEGIVHRSPHFPDWKDYPLRKILQRKLKLPFVLDNDANMAALGEAWRGAAKGCLSFVLLTLGTGIGGGIVIDGKLLHGDSGFAGELGHLVIEREGRRCHCGGRGCLEMYASATGIRYEISKSPETLYHLALRGNKAAKKIWENFGGALGTGVASLVNALDIETVILGGGLSGAWKMFIPAVRRAIARHTYPTTAKRIGLKRASLQNDAGLVGAARAAFLSLSF